MNLSKQNFLLILFSFFLIGSTYSAHIIGGHMSYKCLGDNEYEFEITLYRDCANGGANFDSFGNSLIGTVTIFRGESIHEIIKLDEPEVMSWNLSLNNPCDVNPSICVEQGVCKFRSILPKLDETYTITYQRCCRTASIVNLKEVTEIEYF